MNARPRYATGARRPGRRKVMESAQAYEAVGPRERVERVVGFLGNKVTAEILHVSPSQPSRWRSEIDRVSERHLRQLIDLDYVVTRLLMLFTPAVAIDWLHGDNPFVGGRPVDVMRLRGPAAILDAIDGEESGAYA